MFIFNGLDVNSIAHIIDYVIRKGYVVNYLVVSYHVCE